MRAGSAAATALAVYRHRLRRHGRGRQRRRRSAIGQRRAAARSHGGRMPARSADGVARGQTGRRAGAGHRRDALSGIAAPDGIELGFERHAAQLRTEESQHDARDHLPARHRPRTTPRNSARSRVRAFHIFRAGHITMQAVLRAGRLRGGIAAAEPGTGGRADRATAVVARSTDL